MNTRMKFLSLMVALADLVKTAHPSFTLTKELLGIYERTLESIGLHNACAALERIIITRRSRDPFPSAHEIREIVQPTLTPENEGKEAVDLIWIAVSKFGSYSTQEAMEFIGELGQEIVKRFGGWTQICRTQSSQMGIMRAQMIKAGIQIYERAKLGMSEVKPQIPKSSEQANFMIENSQQFLEHKEEGE